MSATILQFPCTRQPESQAGGPSAVQRAWLLMGLHRPNGQLPMSVGGVWVRDSTARACLARGWVVQHRQFRIATLLGPVFTYRLTQAGIEAARTGAGT